MDVNQMSAREVSAEIPATLDDLGRAVRQGPDDNVRVLETGRSIVGRVENGFPTRQHLGPTFGELTLG